MAEMTIAIRPFKRMRSVSVSENPPGSGWWAVVMHIGSGTEEGDLLLLAEQLRFLASRIEGRPLGEVPDLSDWKFTP